MTFLQVAWFILITFLLTGYALLDGFDLGVGFWNILLKDKKKKQQLIDAIGPFWDGNEVWLLTGAGAVFAAFPAVYASTFSAFYLAMYLVVFALIFRALSIEFRNKIESDSWYKIWDVAFTVGSVLASILFGVAIGNIIKGVPLDSAANYTGTFFDLLTPYPIIIGVTSLAMFIIHGATFLKTKVEDDLKESVINWIDKSWYLYSTLLIVALITTLVNYQHELLHLSIIFAIISILATVMIKVANKGIKKCTPILFSSISIISNMIVVATTIFPFMVPNFQNPELGLTIFNASSSEKTLTAMFIMAIIGMPIVIGYTIFLYKVFSKNQRPLT